MSILNQFVSYWFDCINSEDILGKDISINVRTKAVLYPFDYDPFIFNTDVRPVEVSDNKTILSFAKNLYAKGEEVYYGFPLLFYSEMDNYGNKKIFKIAPLFTIRMKFIQDKGNLYLDTDEGLPSCGIMALNKLGLKTEEISNIGQEIEKIMKQNLDAQTRLDESIRLIQNEAELTINENLNPMDFSQSAKIQKSMVPGIYNSNVLFDSENTIFNYSLLQDLADLKTRNDLEKTALSFLIDKSIETNNQKDNNFIPILPFPTNEYQIAGIQKTFRNPLTVVTGPPGTGKSQFISNLVINFYLEGKTVLFVSHTNEAVEIVNQKINEQFNNLIFRTGRKEYRQELEGKFSDLLIDSARKPSGIVTKRDIKNLWDRILLRREDIVEINRLFQKYENNYEILRDIADNLSHDIDSLKEVLKGKSFELNNLKVMISELDRIEEENFKFFEKLWYSLLPFLKSINIEKIKRKINSLLVESEIGKYITMASKDSISELNLTWTKRSRARLDEILKAFNIYNQNKNIREEIESFQTHVEIESNIRELENKYYGLSRKYIRDFYLKDIASKQILIGKVKSFLKEVSSSRMHKDIDSYLFENAIKMLKIWSSTLKSLRRSFPLKSALFDYVIFDESSQVDLPSAVPALYRAKKAIIVGDPKQLTHIAGITKDMDKEIAEKNNLLAEKEYYPHKIRYCDTSLYFSAENSNISSPIFLNNHYRSEDQIITLCNKIFYEERLKIMSSLDFSRFPNSLPMGVEWVDCAGEVYKNPEGSRVNMKEVEEVKNLYENIMQKIDMTDLSIGIVTPFRRQADAIYNTVSKITPIEKMKKHNIRVMTAHKFQGSEKDIMIFSLVLASKGNGSSDTWYNIYPQILNVALSRAKYLLYIVGDKNFASNHSCSQGEHCILKRIIKNYEEIKGQEDYEIKIFRKNFDSPVEQYLYEKLQLRKRDIESYGYKLVPKLVFKRYTLDFALIPNKGSSNKKKINIECDGKQHQVIEGIPVIEDVERDSFLTNHGWKVLRFPNYEITERSEKVINQIIESIKPEN